jgi:hypothetical protein
MMAKINDPAWHPDEPTWVKMLHEVERLRAIVDKLPKTADGVPVVPGETYYAVTTWPDCDDPPVIVGVKWVGHCDPVMNYQWVTVKHGNFPEEFKVVRVLSTQEAAEKAAKHAQEGER